MRRLKRILIRLGILFLVLGVIGLVAFTWFAYWPLEGSWDKIERLVPDDVDFVLRASWKDMKQTGWLQENLRDHPVIPAVGETLERELDKGLAQLRQQEEQINAQIPLGIATFGFEDDVVPGEIVAAGRMCRASGPERGVPRWREILLLTRVSWKAKFFAALKHGFVRDRLGPNLRAEEIADGVYKFTLTNQAASPLKSRQICGPGTEIPPENVWYGTRVKDVLGFSNSEDLIRSVARLAEFPDSGRDYLSRAGMKLDAPKGGIAISMDLRSLEYYLINAIEDAGAPFTILQEFLTITALDRMNGFLAFPGKDLVRGHADIQFLYDQLTPGAQEVYNLGPESLKSGAVSLVPAEDTFAALLVRSPPLHLIRAIYRHILTTGDRALWNSNLRRMGGYQDIDQFFVEFASKLGDTAGIAVGRVSEVFDKVEYPEWYSNPVDNPDASPQNLATAMVVRLAQGLRTEELDQFLADKVPLLGVSDELEKVEYRGLTYTRVNLKQRMADYALASPCWLLAQDHFVFCSNESYFRKMIDTIVEPKVSPPLYADPTFLAAAAALPEQAHVALYVDLDKLFTIPPRTARGAQPRGWMWDRRNLWVINNRDTRTEAIRYRNARKLQFQHENGRMPNVQEELAIEDDVSAHVASWTTRYEDFLEEYRKELRGYRRLRAFGVSFSATRQIIRGDAALILQEAPEGG